MHLMEGFLALLRVSIRILLNASSAINKSLQDLCKTSILHKHESNGSVFNLNKDEAELIIYHKKGEPILAYELVLRPNALER